MLPFHNETVTDETIAIPCADRVTILAYADDTLVLLRDQSDFTVLQMAINTYMLASNAVLNMSKTEAFSLSGSPLPNWQVFLCDVGITSWHDRSAPYPLQYLGYPLCSSVTQKMWHSPDWLTLLDYLALFIRKRSYLFEAELLFSTL